MAACAAAGGSSGGVGHTRGGHCDAASNAVVGERGGSGSGSCSGTGEDRATGREMTNSEGGAGEGTAPLRSRRASNQSVPKGCLLAPSGCCCRRPHRGRSSMRVGVGYGVRAARARTRASRQLRGRDEDVRAGVSNAGTGESRERTGCRPRTGHWKEGKRGCTLKLRFRC